MTQRGFSLGTAGLVLLVFAATAADSLGQWPLGVGFRGPGAGAAAPLPPGSAATMGYGGYSPFLGVYMPSANGYNSGGYDPNAASVPSTAYFTYGNISYTTESPSPLPVYGPRSPFAPLPPALPLTALLKVQAPLDAEVWLEGHKMRSTGTLRHYRSPPLDPAKGYAYEVRARWLIDGKAVEDVRHIAIRAGATVLVDFTHLDPLVPRPSAPPPPRPPSIPGASS